MCDARALTCTHALRMCTACALHVHCMCTVRADLHARAQQRLELGAALEVLGVRRTHGAQVATLDLLRVGVKVGVGARSRYHLVVRG